MNNFTPENLLQFLYDETEDVMRTGIENELSASWTLNEKLKVLQEAQQRLNKISLLAPRQQTINSILAYADQAERTPHK
ncbi:MAG: hypothetical protein JWN76_789 [Chitinophagaceae bacterium]|nr:hypothetical protein [Chitinophagaceae bacterium]